MASPDVLDRSQRLLSAHSITALHLHGARADFLQKASHDLTTHSDSALSLDPTNPALVGADLKMQTDFFGKLKFKFVEQQTKENFLKKITAPDPPLVQPEDNASLEEQNREEKGELKRAKVDLESRSEEMERLVEDICKEHDEYESEIAQVTSLVDEIRAMQLEIAKLRATHPPEERLTPSAASSILDAQIIDLQTLSDTLERQATSQTAAKRALASSARELDGLGAERAAAERLGEEARRARGEVEEGVGEVNRWLDAAREAYQASLGIQDISTPSTSTLHIAFSPPSTTSSSGDKPCTLVLTLNPASWRLLSGSLVNAPPGVDVSDAVERAKVNDDAVRLIQEVFWRLRGGGGWA